MAYCAKRAVFRLLGTVMHASSSAASPAALRPLDGVTVVELAGLAPAPFCGMILADFGASVTVIGKDDEVDQFEQRLMRGKFIMHANLKTDEGLRKVREMCLKSDILLDPFRPGTLEKIGLDPVELLKENEKLIIARITGYGQTGEMSHLAGHDINFVSMSGLLPTIAGQSSKRKPYWPPANILGDFAGGSLTAAFGIVLALLQRHKNGGKGAIIDASMVDGVAYLGSFISMYQDIGLLFNFEHAAFSGDCPIYRTYETSDGKFMAVGALEKKFNSELFKTLGLSCKYGQILTDPEAVTREMEQVFKSKTRDEWVSIFKDTDACVTPVLNLDEVGTVPHHNQRRTFSNESNKWIPHRAPRLYTAKQFAALQKGPNSKY